MKYQNQDIKTSELRCAVCSAVHNCITLMKVTETEASPHVVNCQMSDCQKSQCNEAEALKRVLMVWLELIRQHR